jgi:protein tyrosine phosphatase (PTP) superfamily phosphohydrolase (DUF442 family)
MKRFFFLMTASALAVAMGPGCLTTRESCAPVSCFPRYTGPTPSEAPCDRCRQALLSPRLTPVPAPTTAVLPPTENLAGAVQPGSYSSSAFLDANGRPWFNPGVRLAAPIPELPDSESDATPNLGAPMPQPPLVPGDSNVSSPAPVDIPQFATAKERTASGLQPFPDGIAWLQAHGYRTVLHVRAPGEDDAAARRQFEKHGLRYLSLEAAPETLSKAVVDEFDRIVTTESDLPLFVYDKDGAVAGGLWYLYFRTVENAPDEQARTEAAGLGLRPDENGAQRTMWIAIQNYLRQ